MRRRLQSRRYAIGLLCCVCILIFIVWQVGRSVEDPNENYSEKDKEWFGEWRSHLKEDTKLILLYSTWFSQRVWNKMDGPNLFNHFKACPKHKNCLLTYDRAWLSRSNVALFHGRDVEDARSSYYSAAKLRQARKTVPKEQLWVYLSHENPQKYTNIYKPYDGIFNSTATFDRRSDMFVAYSAYAEYEKPQENKRNYAKEKRGLVSWAVSNCGLMREEFALELEKYIDITVYGKCRTHFKKQRDCKHFDDACNKELSTYKFYLAFENDFCHDYVTEKYWERIQQEVVPIVMGANYDKGLVIPGSYIDVSDFDSIQKLAEYLRFLDKNDDEYNKYFSYKSKYAIAGDTIYCQICAILHEKSVQESKQVQLSEVFNYETNCGVYRPQMERFRKMIEYSQRNDSKIYLFTVKVLRLLHLWSN